jgi:DNA excision repair protein ERCC-2
MSGTLNPTVMYKDLLGIQGGICKQYESPFPPENKLALIVPETSTKYNLRTEQMFKKMADITGKIAAQVPGNIALFFPSYDLRDKVCAFFESKKHLFYEKRAMSKDEKEKFLSDFKDKKEEGAVLLGVTGANFAEGVDFPGDLLQGVIVIGLPLARPDLKTKETIKYYDSKFGKGWDYGYIFPAMNKCVQSAGRCIRSGTDTGVIIYLDERFAWQKYYSCLPRERLIVSKEYEKYIEAFLNQ